MWKQIDHYLCFSFENLILLFFFKETPYSSFYLRTPLTWGEYKDES